MGRYARGALSGDEARASLEEEKAKVSRFITVAGIRTSDGETGSVGPQVAESLAQQLGTDFPHATYVEDLEVEPGSSRVRADRRIAGFVQRVELDCPGLLTLAPEYVPRTVPGAAAAAALPLLRADEYRTKIAEPFRLSASDLKADQSRLGFDGSVVIVWPAVLIGNPPAQKVLDKTLVFVRHVGALIYEGKEDGPFVRGDIADALPSQLKLDLVTRGDVEVFSVATLVRDVFAT